MLKDSKIMIELVKGSQSEYIIKDICGITIGRIYITELSKENRYCSIKIKFYQSGEKSYENLKESLNKLLLLLFKNMGINKVNIYTDEEINTAAFIDLGFEIEGLITNSIVEHGELKCQIIFGLESDNFGKLSKDRNVFLSGKNIELKILTPNNAGELLSYYERNEAYLKGFEPKREESFFTLDGQKRLLNESYRQFINGSSLNLGIYKKSKFIGKIQLSNIVMGVFKSAFVGYSIDKEEQGRGYMKEALRLLVDYAFEEIGLHRIEASTLTDNIKSQRVLLACGFKKLGINEEYLYINGKWCDHATFYKLNNL